MRESSRPRIANESARGRSSARGANVPKLGRDGDGLPRGRGSAIERARIGRRESVASAIARMETPGNEERARERGASDESEKSESPSFARAPIGRPSSIA